MWTESNPPHTTSQPLAPTTPHQMAPAPEDCSNSLVQALPEQDKRVLRKLTPRQLHELHCSVCEHPFRVMIEEEFLHWISPDRIGQKYEIGWRCIYRHAHATGLFERRYRNIRAGLAHIVEYAGELSPTSRDVIRAIHHLARINAKGEWIEPTKRVVLSSDNLSAAPPPAIPAAASPKRPRRAPRPRKQPSRKTR